MRNPFTLLKDLYHKIKRALKLVESLIHKPVEQEKKEINTKVFVPKHEYHDPPEFESKLIATRRSHRKIRNRIQAASRKINRVP